MVLLKSFIVIIGLIFSVYLFCIGLPKCKREGFKLNILDLFRQTPLSTATGGYIITVGILSVLFSLMLYFIWF
jgi:hypothetical protein